MVRVFGDEYCKMRDIQSGKSDTQEYAEKGLTKLIFAAIAQLSTHLLIHRELIFQHAKQLRVYIQCTLSNGDHFKSAYNSTLI